MNSFQSPLPDIDSWRRLTQGWIDRTKCSRSSKALEFCTEQKFMMAQAMCNGLAPTQGMEMRSMEEVLSDLENEISGLFQFMELTFVCSCFGQTTLKQFGERAHLGWWCLVLEFATMARAGSTIEFNIGSLPHGIELEIGTDCRTLEHAEILGSPAFHFASQLMPVTRAIDLKCPLGGGAIQLDILGNSSPSRRRAA